MAAKDILLLGDPRLYAASEPVRQADIPSLGAVIRDLHDTLVAYRAKQGAGRAIAAPQIGVPKRIVYVHTGTPLVLLNPALVPASDETMEIWDDCMSFPGLLVRVKRHQACKVTYRDMEWRERCITVDGDMAELLQHECDHLDGILAVARAIDGRSFRLKSQ